MVKGKVNTEATREGLRLQAASLVVVGGKSHDEVVELLNVAKRSLGRWVKEYRAGERNFSDKPGRGRKRSATTDTVKNRVVRHMRGKRFQSCRKVASRLQISRESVRRCLKEKGLKPVQTKSKPKLSEKNITARIEFAETHRNTDWSKVMFTDEKDFWLFSRVSKKNDVVWVADGDEPPPTVDKVRATQKVHVWGGITTRGKTKLYFYDGALNAEKYRTLVLQKALKEIKELLPDSSYTFQQDGAPCHTANVTQAFLSSQPFSFLPKADWPGNSPDLNPIENLWAKLQTAVNEREPKDVSALKRAINKEWSKMDNSFVARYIMSMPRRRDAVRNSNGMHTKY